ncbi:MFS transporter [Streptomyces sp. NPDC005728]|uniref:MFS transporter n=1 Tax=Streptomyces sp. NPDC005728 TaxID=3157054 RepID=UPI0033CE7A8C
MSRPDRPGRGFRLLWAGQSVSLFGSQITTLALPLIAVLSLHATPVEVGVLGAVRFLPFVMLALPVGVLVDLGRRRSLMITADVARAVLTAAVPVLGALGMLGITTLYAVAFALGVFQVVFDAACQSFVPDLVRGRELVGANQRLMSSQSAADAGGPGIAGVAVQFLNVGGALILDAVSFLVSACCLSFIRDRESPTAARLPGTRPGTGLLAQIGEGVRAVLGRGDLRVLAGLAAVFNLLEQGLMVVFLVYAVQDLHLGPGMLGLVLSAAGAGALAGAVSAKAVAARLGVGRTLVVSTLIDCVAYLLVPLAAGPRPLLVLILMTSFGLAGLSTAVFSVQSVTLRQAVTPQRLQGRVNASFLLAVYGPIPIGALLGGVLGQQLGLRPALFVLMAGFLCGPVWVLRSELRAVHGIPDRAGEPDRIRADAPGRVYAGGGGWAEAPAAELVEALPEEEPCRSSRSS